MRRKKILKKQLSINFWGRDACQLDINIESVKKNHPRFAKDLSTMILQNISFLRLTFCSVYNLKNHNVIKDSGFNRYWNFFLLNIYFHKKVKIKKRSTRKPL